MSHIERNSWSQTEAQRIGDALARARFWQSIEPHKCAFWSVVDETLLAHYPDCRFKRDEQVTLDDFAGNPL